MNNQENSRQNTPSLPEALYDFVATYTVPELPQTNIFHADQNSMSLPEETEEYAVITILHTISHGTPVKQFEDCSVSITTLYEYFIQIDFFSESKNARKRAIHLANIGRSSVAVDFFNRRGMSVTSVSDPKDMAFVGDTKQYVKRWAFLLQVTRPESFTLPAETSCSVVISRVSKSRPDNPTTNTPTSYFEDVDVHHKP